MIDSLGNGDNPSGSQGRARLLCLGEIAWDRLWILDQLPQGERDCQLISEKEMPGGSALNTACGLRFLGAPVDLAGNALGQDAYGTEILRYLSEQGIVSQTYLDSGRRTPFCQVLIDRKSGRRSFIVSHAKIQRQDAPWLKNLIQRTREGCYSHLFVQPYLHELTLHFLEQVKGRSRGWVLIQDVHLDSPHLPLADAVQLSLPESTMRLSEAHAFAREFLKGQCSSVFLTGGEQGLLWVRKEEAPRHFPAAASNPPRQAVDTTGCGDAFRAGLMHALWQNAPIEEAIARGQELAARKSEVFGSHLAMENGTD